MRGWLVTAVSVTATTSISADIPAEVTINSGMIARTPGATPSIRVFKGIPYAAATGKAQIFGDSVAPETRTLPAAAKLAFFDSAYQQLLKGGANQ